MIDDIQAAINNVKQGRKFTDFILNIFFLLFKHQFIGFTLIIITFMIILRFLSNIFGNS